MSHELHYCVVLINLVLQLDVFLHGDFKKIKYSNKYIFISYILACNEIKSLKCKI